MNYIFAGLIGFSLAVTIISVYDLFFKKDELEELEWIPLPEDGRI